MLSVPKQELNGQFAMLPMDDVHFGSGSVQKLGAALEQFLLRKIRIAGEETRVGGEREVLLFGQIFPLSDCLVHPARLLCDQAAARGILCLRKRREGQRAADHKCE